MKKIRVGKNNFALVDDEDFDLLSRFTWQLGSGCYALRDLGWGKNRKHIWMHKLIVKGSEKEIVDHINGDTLDNRKVNLRISSHQQNIANQKIHKNNTTGFKGVTWFKRIKKWHAKITFNYKCFHLGYFDNKIEAAKAYNKAALKYFGEFARLNQI